MFAAPPAVAGEANYAFWLVGRVLPAFPLILADSAILLYTIF